MFLQNSTKKTSEPAVIHVLPTPQHTNNFKSPTSSNGVSQGSSSNISSPSSVSISSTSSQWTESQSGAIVLKEPIVNQTISSGAIVTGLAKVNNVGYILIDNQVGVISQGTIPVINGSFAAKINFKPYASSGRLDVFSTTANGKEENLIEINVNF